MRGSERARLYDVLLVCGGMLADFAQASSVLGELSVIRIILQGDPIVLHRRVRVPAGLNDFQTAVGPVPANALVVPVHGRTPHLFHVVMLGGEVPMRRAHGDRFVFHLGDIRMFCRAAAIRGVAVDDFSVPRDISLL